MNLGAIKKERTWTHHNNYPYGEYIRDDLGEKGPRELYNTIPEEIHEILENYVPYGEHGIYTIESIIVYPKPKIDILL